MWRRRLVDLRLVAPPPTLTPLILHGNSAAHNGKIPGDFALETFFGDLRFDSELKPIRPLVSAPNFRRTVSQPSITRKIKRSRPWLVFELGYRSKLLFAVRPGLAADVPLTRPVLWDWLFLRFL